MSSRIRRGYAQSSAAPKILANPAAPPPAASTYSESRSYAAADDDSIDLRSPETLDALVRPLLRKGIFTRVELAEELEKLKFTLS